jgi:hypothetical protein
MKLDTRMNCIGIPMQNIRKNVLEMICAWTLSRVSTVDDPEEERRGEVGDEADEVRQRLALGDRHRASSQHRELRAESGHGAGRRVQGRAVLIVAVAPVREAVALGPLIEHGPNARGGGEIFVHEVEDELGGVGVRGGRGANLGEVRAHLLRLAEVRDAAHGEDHGVVESPRRCSRGVGESCTRRRMFSSAAIFLRKLIMRTADAESTPLVGSSRNRIFGRFASASATERRRLLPLGQAAHDLVARLGVLELLEADAVNEVLHFLVADRRRRARGGRA